ncbi:MAG: hypothetical protein IKB43_01020 [Fibrobacter sp.]|nr:hypothetical protein [Fibrobacter sp.]
MFYRHWKKIALALTGFFWAGCGDSTSDHDSSFDKKEDVGMSVEDSVGMVVALYGAPADFKSITLCFNDMAKNEAGKEFKIIDCTDGNRYLRDPSDATGEGVVLPEGVEALAPEAGSDKAKNCESAQEVCIERNPNLDPDPLAGCFPTINCPEKPTEDE